RDVAGDGRVATEGNIENGPGLYGLHDLRILNDSAAGGECTQHTRADHVAVTVLDQQAAAHTHRGELIQGVQRHSAGELLDTIDAGRAGQAESDVVAPGLQDSAAYVAQGFVADGGSSQELGR